MRKINTNKIEKITLAVQIVCAVFIILGYYINRTVMMIAAAGVSTIFMLSNAKWNQKIAFLMFMLSFSSVFKFSYEQTSLFMFLKLSVVASFLMRDKGKFSFSLVTLAILFATYAIVISEINNLSYMTDVINVLLWTFIGYVMVNVLVADDLLPVTRSFSNAVIITGILGFFIEQIPTLNLEVKILGVMVEGGYTTSRYAALWTDPNFYTVVLIAALWFGYIEYNYGRTNTVEFALRSALLTFIGFMTLSKSCLLLLCVFWLYTIVTKNNIKTTHKVSIVFFSFIALSIFITSNTYWLSDMIYRFTGGQKTGAYTASTITTGRVDIWEEYIKALLDKLTWIFGEGLRSQSVHIGGRFRPSHNILIQMIHYLGAVGSAIYISLIVSAYKTPTLKNNRRKKSSGIYIMTLLSLFSTMFFLDGLLIEMYYFVLPIAVIYANSVYNSETNKDSEFLDERSII